jgi:NADH-quinone oxidoreductase subunit C
MLSKDKKTLLVDVLGSEFAGQILETEVYRGDVTHVVGTDSIAQICTFLNLDPRFRMNFIVDVLGVDYPGRDPRFDVVYVLYSTSQKLRVRLKVRVADGGSVPSVTSVWEGAAWPERETYDMFGIRFDNHPDMRRIYLAEDWEGHPLRKDYPLRGYKDRYNPFGEEKPE